jgi:redox-sensitive bicupin YhaK (pirin superfamily)
MVRIIRANERHFSDFGWLQTYWLFSFSDYYDPNNIQFGALRVFNDDVVQPGMGFPTHPHQEMEIVTIVLEGQITHADSMGNKAVIRAGDVQRMSAGTGLTHSEFNLADTPVHFYQIWIYPDEKGLTPTYDQRNFAEASWKNKLVPVASGQGIGEVVTFHTDATIYRGDFGRDKDVRFETGENRRIFVYVTDGQVQVDEDRLKSKDQARIDPEDCIHLKALSDAKVILIDVPSCKGWGYDRTTLRGARK